MIELLAAIFIAVIFISSYAAYGANLGNGGAAGGSGQNRSATTTIPPVGGKARAGIASYGTVLDVNVTCANATRVASSLNGYLNALESNGSIGNFYSPENNQVLVQLGNLTAPRLYGALAARLGSNATCTGFTTQATLLLPGTLNTTYGKVRIPTALRSYPIGLALSNTTGGNVSVSVLALVARNGTAYQVSAILNR